LTTLDSTHLAYLLSNSRFPVFTEDAVALSRVEGRALKTGHLDSELILLARD